MRIEGRECTMDFPANEVCGTLCPAGRETTGDIAEAVIEIY